MPSTGESFYREFVPADPDNGRKFGHLVLRFAHYGHRLANFDNLFGFMVADAREFEPPLELTREDVAIIHFAGERYRETFGITAHVPAEHIVPDTYTRLSQLEYTL